ncbi:MAG TPA: hypothetical protein VK889_01375 [Solirubrobacterales bacterium]|nr:hypothetical protein [Solirubrobacterales bacterium]
MTSEIGDSGSGGGGRPLPPALARLEATLVDACAEPAEWPAQIAAGVYAGVDYVIANPALIQLELLDQTDGITFYEGVIARFAQLIRLRAPIQRRLPGSTDEALVASIVGLVGDHVRVGRLDRLAELRPELVLLTLLPYLGFADAQRWANQTAPS